LRHEVKAEVPRRYATSSTKLLDVYLAGHRMVYMHRFVS
jgi:hypothetical protein